MPFLTLFIVIFISFLFDSCTIYVFTIQVIRQKIFEFATRIPKVSLRLNFARVACAYLQGIKRFKIFAFLQPNAEKTTPISIHEQAKNTHNFGQFAYLAMKRRQLLAVIVGYRKDARRSSQAAFCLPPPNITGLNMLNI